MAAAGDLAVSAAQAAGAQPGYILVVEGAIATGAGGKYCRLWTGMSMHDGVVQVAQNASFIIALGACAAYGGTSAGAPNPTEAKGVGEILGSENKTLAHPASVDSIPTSLGQEDHVSMGAIAAVKAWRTMDNAETVLAIEMMCAAQALDFRAPLSPGRGVAAAHGEIRKVITHADRDRSFGEDIEESLALLRAQKVAKAVESRVGELT